MKMLTLVTRGLKRTQRLLVVLVEALAGLLLMAMVVVVFAGVLDRFVLGIGFPWPEELSRFLLIWLSFLSAALAVTNQSHYVLDYVYKRMLGPFGQTVIGGLFANAVSLLTAVVLMVKGADLATRVSWQGAPAMEISMSWIYAALPVSLGLISLFHFTEMLDLLTGLSRKRKVS